MNTSPNLSLLSENYPIQNVNPRQDVTHHTILRYSTTPILHYFATPLHTYLLPNTYYLTPTTSPWLKYTPSYTYLTNCGKQGTQLTSTWAHMLDKHGWTSAHHLVNTMNTHHNTQHTNLRLPLPPSTNIHLTPHTSILHLALTTIVAPHTSADNSRDKQLWLLITQLTPM